MLKENSLRKFIREALEGDWGPIKAQNTFYNLSSALKGQHVLLLKTLKDDNTINSMGPKHTAELKKFAKTLKKLSDEAWDIYYKIKHG